MSRSAERTLRGSLSRLLASTTCRYVSCATSTRISTTTAIADAADARFTVPLTDVAPARPSQRRRWARAAARRVTCARCRRRSAGAAPRITKLATSDDPPYEMNGNVTPVSGITRVTPPMITNVWTPMIVVSPAANSFENGRSACTAMRKPVPTNSRNRDEHRDGPDEAELLTDRGEHEVGRRRSGSAADCRGRARCPANPPVPNANIDCTIWKPLSCATGTTGRATMLDAVLHVAERAGTRRTRRRGT